MFDVVFYWMIGALCVGLVVVLACAYPDLKRDYRAYQKAFGRE